MKKTIRFAFLGFGLFLAFSCKKTKDDVNKATEFDISYSTSLSVPAASVVANVPADFTTPDIDTQSSTKFAAEKTSKDLIDEVKMTKFSISTSTLNLNSLKSFSVFIKASGLGEAAIASKTNIPQNVTSVSADLGDVNIKEYIFKDKIQFRVSVTVNAGMVNNMDLKLDQTVHVKGKQL